MPSPSRLRVIVLALPILLFLFQFIGYKENLPNSADKDAPTSSKTTEVAKSTKTVTSSSSGSFLGYVSSGVSLISCIFSSIGFATVF